MGLSDLILSYGALAGTHTGGHFDEAAKQGIPMYLDLKNMNEVWEEPDRRSDRTRMNAAGFELQDLVSDKLPGLGKKESDLANAIYHTIYASGKLPMTAKGGRYEDGDIGGIARNSGLPHHTVRQMVMATALADLIRSQDDDAHWKVRFHAKDGFPGLMLDYRW